MGRMFDDARRELHKPHLLHLVGQYPEFRQSIVEAISTTKSWKELSESRLKVELQEFTNGFLASSGFQIDTEVKDFLEDYEVAPDLDGAVVFKADNVAKFYIDHHQSTNLADFLPTYAPIFRKFWVEYDTGLDLPQIAGQRRVGVLFNSYDWEDHPEVEGDPDNWRWSLEAFIYLGIDSVRIAGPFFVWRIFVSADGSPFKEILELPRCKNLVFETSSEQEWWDSEIWNDLRQTLSVDAAKLIRPALLTLGFLHCKNVERVEHPATPVKKKAKRRGLIGKSRYFTLEIEAMRKVLESDGEIGSRGLGNALHICRGHFKTFTADAPLLGKATGTYWWSPQVRGKRDQGVITKDYAVSPPQQGEDVETDLGAEWIPLRVEDDIESTSTFRDGEASTRGLRAHHEILEKLREVLVGRNIEPRRPRPSEPQFDMGFEFGGAICIVEAKSLTDSNFENQLRLGIGQLAGYRYHVQRSFPTTPVRAFLLVEIEPPDGDWVEICEQQDIALIWPGMFHAADFLE